MSVADAGAVTAIYADILLANNTGQRLFVKTKEDGVVGLCWYLTNGKTMSFWTVQVVSAWSVEELIILSGRIHRQFGIHRVLTENGLTEMHAISAVPKGAAHGKRTAYQKVGAYPTVKCTLTSSR